MSECREQDAVDGRCVLIDGVYPGCSSSCFLAKLRSVLSPMGPASGVIGYALHDSIEDPETGEHWVQIRLT
jgi:hypothetical protein